MQEHQVDIRKRSEISPTVAAERNEGKRRCVDVDAIASRVNQAQNDSVDRIGPRKAYLRTGGTRGMKIGSLDARLR